MDAFFIEISAIQHDFKLFLRTLTGPYIILIRNRKLTFHVQAVADGNPGASLELNYGAIDHGQEH
jgi:hypothetical protein